MGYFFWLKDNIRTTKVAKETANISESSIGISTTSFPGSEPTTLEYPILLLLYYTIFTLESSRIALFLQRFYTHFWFLFSLFLAHPHLNNWQVLMNESWPINEPFHIPSHLNFTDLYYLVNR